MNTKLDEDVAYKPRQQWQSSDDELEPHMKFFRHGCAAVAIDEHRVLVMGGMGAEYRGGGGIPTSDILRSTEVYDRRTRQWTRAPDNIQPRWYHQAVMCQGKVYTCGGSSKRDDTIEYLDVSSEDIHSPATKGWQLLSDRQESLCSSFLSWIFPPAPTSPLRLPKDVSFHALASVGRFLYILGSSFDSKVGSKMHTIVVDVKSKEMVHGPPLLIYRHGFHATTIGNTIWVVGGRRGKSSELDAHKNEYFEISDPESIDISWHTSPDCPGWKFSPATLEIGRNTPAVTSLGQSLVVAGAIIPKKICRKRKREGRDLPLIQERLVQLRFMILNPKCGNVYLTWYHIDGEQALLH